MLFIDSLIQKISKNLSSNAMHETAYISNIDLQYTSGQLNIHRDAVRHCNFNLISGDMTALYRFRTVFYGLTDMTAQIQKPFD